MLETKLTAAPRPAPSHRPPDWVAWILAVVGAGVVLALVVATNSFRLMPDNPPIYDPDIYLAMAQNPANPLSHVPPFEWRILTPLLVSWLPLPPLVGFMLITWLALVACAGLLYKICVVLGVPRPLWAIPLFFTCHYASAFLVQNYMIVDPACLFFILLAFYALFTHRSWLYISALLLGVLNKETVLAVAVAGLFYPLTERAVEPRHSGQAVNPSARFNYWKNNWWLLVGAGLAASVVLGLRWLIPAPDYSLGSELHKIISLRLSGHLPRQLFSIVALSFGPLLGLFFYRPRHTLAWLWQHPVLTIYLGLATAQVFIASQNARLVVYGLVTVIPLALVKLDLLVKRYRLRPLYVYGSVVLIQLIFYALLWPHLLFWN